MAPKSGPRRTTARTTARKTLPPTVPSQCTSNPKASSATSSSQDSPVAPPPPSGATARSASGFPLNDAGLLTSLDNKYKTKIENSSPSVKSSPPIMNSNPQPQDKIKKFGKKIRVGDEVQELAVLNLGSATNPQPQDKIKKSGKKIRVGDEIQERAVLNSGSASNPQSQGKIKKPGKKIRVGDEVQERAVLNLGSAGPVLVSCNAQDTILAMPKNPAAGGSGAELESSNGGGSSLEGETGPGTMVVADAGLEVKGKRGDEALAEVDKASAIEATGSAKVGEGRTRKVVKKTVRIVKKIVKRRVPKRVVTGSVGNEETQRVENVGQLKEGNEKWRPEMNELDSMEVEKVDCNGTVEKVDSDGTVERADCNGTVGNEEMDSVANVGILKERDESLELAMNELNSIEVGKVDPSGAVSMKTEKNSKPNGAVALEVENEDSKEIQGQEAKEITKINPSAESIVKGEDVEELGDSISGSLSQGLVADENDGNEGLMVEDQLENENVNLVEMKSVDFFEDQSAGLIQERRQDGEEVVKEVVEKNDVGLNGGLALSGEMEALERRKRRRTEIFLGGLDKDTNEEDIRRLFEQVGEVTQVRLVMNTNSGKNKGFAFLRFASAADAKKALEKYSTVEVTRLLQT